MIDVGKLHTDLVAQDDKLREFMAYWTGFAHTQPGKSTAEILAEGLCAIHERLGNIAELLAVKS
jgi:hypothetical protein